MKKWFTHIWLQVFLILILFLSVLTLKGQTYCYQFEERVVGSKVEVDIILTSSSNFRLGNSNFRFTYNTAALSLPSVVPYVSALSTSYSTTAQRLSSGVVAISVQYNGATNAGRLITSNGVRIGTIAFDIVNPLISREFALLNNGIKYLSTLKDDNTTLLIPSAQCPPSPYSSLFYDANIELDATIPMNECVDTTTPNSLKINFGDDETKEILPAGFKFKFYCEEVTSLKIGADGALLVNSAAGATVPNNNSGKLKSLPKVIAPWWDEWRKGMGSVNCALKDTVIGGSLTRMLILQWNNLSPVDNVTGSNMNTDPLKATFNVVIFENSSIIKFNYKDIDFIADTLGHAELYPIVERKQNGVDGSVGIKSGCSTGNARDGVNNIVFDGPIGISLYDINSARVYKSITFLPISGACDVPTAPLDTVVCQNSPLIKLPFETSAINGTWTGTGIGFLNNKNIQNASFNPSTAGNYELIWQPGCIDFTYTVKIKVNEKPVGRLVTPTNIRQCSNPNFIVKANTPTAGVGKWEKVTGSGIFSTTDTSATIIGVPEGSTTFVRWIVSNGAECNDTITVSLTNTSSPIAAVEKSLIQQCENPFFTAKGIYAGTATGVWSILKGVGAIVGSNTNPSVNISGVLADSTTILQLIVTEGGCSTVLNDTLKNYKKVLGNVLTPNPFRQCDNPNFTLKSAKPQSGIGKWEFVSGSGIFTPNDTSATVVGVPIDGSARVRWIVTNGSCSDTINVDLYNVSKPLASLQKPLIEQCENPNFTVVGIFSAQASGIWSILKGQGTIVGSNTGTQITVNGVPADSTTIVQLVVTEGTCNTVLYDTLKNYSRVTASLVTASPLRQCNNSTFNIAATTPSVGTGVWSRVSGVGVVNMGNPTTVNDVSAGFTTVVKWKVTNGACKDSINLSLINDIQPKTTLVSSPLIEQCGNSTFTIQGGSIPASFASSGTWRMVSDVGTLSSGNPATVSNVPSGAIAIAQWMVINGLCRDSIVDTLVHSIFIAPQLISPSVIEQCGNSTFNVSAVAPSVGTGTWTIESGDGTINGSTNAIVVAGVTVGTTTVLKWKVVNGSCQDSIRVTLRNIAPVGAALSVPNSIQNCNNSNFTVSAVTPSVGTGIWSIASGQGTISGSNPVTVSGVPADSTTVLKWKVVNGVCADSALVTLKNNKFIPAQITTPTPLAQCDNATFNVVAVNPSSGSGAWSLVSGTGILTGTNPLMVSGVTAGMNAVLKWKVVNGTCKDSANITLVNDVMPTLADAGVDQLKCGIDSFKMAAYAPSVGTGTWTIVGSFPTVLIADIHNPITMVKGVPTGASVTLKWTIVNGTCSTSDDVQLTNSAIPTAFAGTDQTHCPNIPFTLSASVIPLGGTGAWRILGTPNGAAIADIHNPLTTVTGLNPSSSVSLEWTVVNQDGCSAKDTVLLSMYEALVPNAGADQVRCNGTFTLAATNPVGKWSVIASTNPINFIDDTQPNTQVTNVAAGDIVVLKWTVSNTNCSASDTVRLYYDNAAPVPIVNKDTVYCNLDTLLTCYGRFKDTLKADDGFNKGTLFYNWSISRNPAYGTPPVASGNTPYIDVLLNVGDYIVSWSIMDVCGNASRYYSFKLKIKDCVPPKIVNYDKFSVLGGSTATNGLTSICATHILKSISDNCTDSAYLVRNLTIVRDEDNPSRTYKPDFGTCIKVSCADVNDTVWVQVWTVDESGTPGYVLSHIVVSDNSGICQSGIPLSNMTISTKTVTDQPVQNVQITAIENSSLNNIEFGNTATNGILTAQSLQIGVGYTFKASKTDEQYLGVTTFDIAFISRHILGLEPIKSPYALLAADVNEDGEIDANDMLIIRNFILKKIPELPRRAWRFTDSSYTIQNRTNPFQEDIPEVISINRLQPNTWRAFKAIKKGDVTSINSATASFATLQERQSTILKISTDDMPVEKGKEYTIPFSVKDFKALSYQFTLGFTEGVADIQHIEMGNLPQLSDGNFALFKNALTTSWNGSASNTDDVTLFKLHFKALKTGQLSDFLTLNSALTATEAIGTDKKLMPIELSFNNKKFSKTDFSLYQNHPNPFDRETTISFNLPTETAAQLTVYALDGRILYTQKQSFSAGQHEVKIDKKDLNASGVLYYRLDTPDFTATRKMVVIK